MARFRETVVVGGDHPPAPAPQPPPAAPPPAAPVEGEAGEQKADRARGKR